MCRRRPRPPPVAADSAMQAAVRFRLRNMLADSVSNICRTVFPQDRSWVGQPKQVQVELLKANHVLLADGLCITPDATDIQPGPVDSPDLEALRARLKQLSKTTLEALCPAVFPSPDNSWRGLLRELLEKHLLKNQMQPQQSPPSPLPSNPGQSKSTDKAFRSWKFTDDVVEGEFQEGNGS